jgi:hypothetical protein
MMPRDRLTLNAHGVLTVVTEYAEGEEHPEPSALPGGPPLAGALDADLKFGTFTGSVPAAVRGLDELRAEAEALGIKVDRRWGDKRLLAEIAKAQT